MSLLTRWMKVHKQPTERLLAVKVFEDAGHGGMWCIRKIFRTFASADAFRKPIAFDHRREFPLVHPKIVTPKQWEINAYLAFGNTIEN